MAKAMEALRRVGEPTPYKLAKGARNAVVYTWIDPSRVYVELLEWHGVYFIGGAWVGTVEEAGKWALSHGANKVERHYTENNEAKMERLV